MPVSDSQLLWFIRFDWDAVIPAEKALTILQLATPFEHHKVLDTLSLGQANLRLLSLRREQFGQELELSSVCSQCETENETTFSIDDLLSQAEHHEKPSTTIVPRIPCLADLIATSSHIANHTEALYERCGGDLNSDTAREDLETWLAEVEHADPFASLVLRYTCHHCKAEGKMRLDVASLVAQELLVAARTLLQDIDLIARHYHWSEQDILALGGRRQWYKAMLLH